MELFKYRKVCHGVRRLPPPHCRHQAPLGNLGTSLTEPDQVFEANYKHPVGEASCIDWDEDRVGGRPDCGKHKSTMA
jgi:hypothetical protein